MGVSMKKRKLGVVLLVILLLATGAIGWGWYQVDQWCSPPFPISGDPVLGWRVYSMGSDDHQPPADAPQLDDWPVTGGPVVVRADLAKELREVLQSHSTYMIAPGDCFEPGMAVTFGKGPDRVDVVICLLCDRAVFYHGGSSEARRLTVEGKQRLKSIYDRLFKPPPTATASSGSDPTN
jgi:hypothetical protein